jgi:hypothetical protein
MVDALTWWPSLSSSPWILLYPQSWFSVASRCDRQLPDASLAARRAGLCSWSGAPGSLVGTTFVTLEFVRQERAMTTQNAPAGTSPAASTATPASHAAVPRPPSWAWRRGALILAGAAQLITISALNSADPLAVTWASLLLAIAPAPLAAAAAFAPAPVNRLAAVIGVLVLVAGIAGAIVHTGLFFVPALVALAVGGVKLWREQS